MPLKKCYLLLQEKRPIEPLVTNVVNTKQKTQAAFNLYCVKTNEHNRLSYEHAKKELEKAYNMVTKKDLSENKKVIESNMIGKHRKR